MNTQVGLRYTSMFRLRRFKHVKFLQVHKAQDIASKRGKLLTEDFLFLLRKVCSALLIIFSSSFLVLFFWRLEAYFFSKLEVSVLFGQIRLK